MTEPPEGPVDPNGAERPSGPPPQQPNQPPWQGPPSSYPPAQPGPYGPPPGQQPPPVPYPGSSGNPYGPPGQYQQPPPGYYPPPGQGSGGYGGPGPLPPNAGGQPPSGNRTSLLIVLGILAVLLVIGGAFAVFGLSSSGGEAEGEATPPGALPTGVMPTDDLPTDGLPTDGLPSDLLTDLPTDLTDLPSLPTEGGPSESEYVDVATAFVEAARDGDCAKAREYANDAFNDTVSDESLCEGTTRAALKDDDLDDYDIEFFGTYGALVTFDDGQTNVSLVSQQDGDPQVQYFIAF